jgi:multiple sugar transport system permease protein
MAARTGRRSSGMSRQEVRWAWMFLAPWVIGFLVFTGGPMLASPVLSFTEYDVISPPSLVGLDNYRQLASDPAVAKSLGNTVFYTALHVPLAMAISLGLALLLQRVGGLGAVPDAVLPAGDDPGGGRRDPVPAQRPAGPHQRHARPGRRRRPGLDHRPDLDQAGDRADEPVDPRQHHHHLPGRPQQRARELYEAARLDGASPWRQFRHITVPMIRGRCSSP